MNKENNQTEQEAIRSALKIIKVLLACFMCTVVFVTLLPQLELIKVTPAEYSLTNLFLIIATILLITGFSIRYYTIKRVRNVSSNELSETLKVITSGYVFTFVVFETIAICGLINFLLGGGASLSLFLGGLSISCMILAWPGKSVFLQHT